MLHSNDNARWKDFITFNWHFLKLVMILLERVLFSPKNAERWF